MTKEPPTDEPNGQALYDSQDYRSVLRHLLDIGVDQARMIPQDARLQALNPASLESIAEAYARVSSAVRRTIMLAERLADPIEEIDNATGS